MLVIVATRLGNRIVDPGNKLDDENIVISGIRICTVNLPEQDW
jgi:hypothetical protein